MAIERKSTRDYYLLLFDKQGMRKDTLSYYCKKAYDVVGLLLLYTPCARLHFL